MDFFEAGTHLVLYDFDVGVDLVETGLVLDHVGLGEERVLLEVVLHLRRQDFVYNF